MGKTHYFSRLEQHTRSHAFNLGKECLRQKVEGRRSLIVCTHPLYDVDGTLGSYCRHSAQAGWLCNTSVATSRVAYCELYLPGLIADGIGN